MNVLNVKLIVILLLVGGGVFYVANNGLLPSATVAELDPNCQLALPEFRTYLCLEERSQSHIYTGSTGTSCGLFGLNKCTTITCNFAEKIEGTKCSITLNNGDYSYTVVKNSKTCVGVSIPTGGSNIPECQGMPSCTMCVGDVYTINNGQTITIEGRSMSMDLTFPTKALYYKETSGLDIRIGSGCDLSTLLGIEQFNNLPKNRQSTMNLNERINSIYRWQAYPTLGNYQTTDGIAVI